MGRFDNYSMEAPSGYEERKAEIEKTMSSFDPAEALELSFKWDGEYYFRILPPEDLDRLDQDWLVPRGFHWRLFPTGDEKKVSKEGCPHVSHGEYCPICTAINKVIAEHGADKEEFRGMNTIGVQKEYLLRILLLRVKNLKKTKNNDAPPKWKEGELPALKVGVFKTGAANRISYLVDPANEDYGWGKITHPNDGVVLKLTHDSTQKEAAKQYVVDPVMELFPIPEKFISDEAVSRWPDIQALLPAKNSQELLAKVEKHQMDIDSRIANAVLAIDAEYGEQKQLESGGEEEETEQEQKPAPKKGKDMAALKEELAKRKAKK